MAPAFHFQPDFTVVADDDRADVQTVRRNRCHTQNTRLGHDDRTADRERVSCRPCRRADNQAVGKISDEVFAVDTCPDGNHRRIVTLQDGNIIQRIRASLEGLAVSLELDHRTLFHLRLALKNLVECSPDFIWSHIRKKAETAHVHADDGYLLRTDPACRLQERTVASQRNDIVDIEVHSLEHAGYGDTSRQLLPQSKVEALVQIDFRIVTDQIF